MPEPKEATAQAGANLLFLREEEIRAAQDLLFFAYRDFTGTADAVLEQLGLGRAHHRAIHFIGRHPGMTVSRLLGILGVTKQSLSRVLTTLIEQGYVAQSAGRADRRQRLLTLTESGTALERQVFERQRECLTNAFRQAGPESVEGFRQVLRFMAAGSAKRDAGGAEPRNRAA
jgi:DNA-binding MarR family transcriptional regulator